MLPAQTVLDFATIQGAASLGMADQIGSLEVGKQADVILIDLNKPHLTPVFDPVSHLAYAAHGSDVCTTIVNGVPLMIDYKFTNLDAEDIMKKAEASAAKLTS